VAPPEPGPHPRPRSALLAQVQAYRAVYERRPDVRRKRTIRMAVYWAVQTGLIERPDACERCGARADEARIHAHHPDYNQPLKVVWLCTLCHGDEHHRLRAERAARQTM
jgi:hypothetical protein